MINEVRNKWNEFPELKSCHHFLYDDLYRDGKKFVLFMGINPGEPKKDWIEFLTFYLSVNINDKTFNEKLNLFKKSNDKDLITLINYIQKVI